MAGKITVIGSANTDYVIHSDKMPKLGETLAGNGFGINAGGKGLNQAVAIAKLGGEASFLGAVGNDANGKTLIEELQKNNVVFDGIIVDDCPTGTAMITVIDGDNFIILNKGANEKLSSEIISTQSEIIKTSDFCVLQLEIPLETVEKVCEIAKNSDVKIVLNPAPYKELPTSILSNIDYLIPNEHEAFELTGVYPDSDENCKKAIKRLQEMGVKNIIITLGERGCVYSVGNEIVFHPAKKTSVVDTTSAGDCFIGAIVAQLSKNKSIEESIDFATKAAAIAVSRNGAAISIPLANEVE